MASRLSGARPPPVLLSREVNSKFVSVERAARETFDTQVEPPGQFGPKSPLLLTASAVFKWQPTQAGWLSSGPSPSPALWNIVKNFIPSKSLSLSSLLVLG